MAFITRTQVVQYDDVSLLAVQGTGTAKFQKSGAPDVRTKTIGAVFTGRLRITRLANGNGYNFLLIDTKRGTDRRRVNFAGNAEVRLGDRVTTVDAYWALLETCERLGI